MRGSISKLKLFKSCRRAYYFKYVEGLEPVKKSEALEVGTNYHEEIEKLYKTGNVDVVNYSREEAMAIAYQKYILPQFKVKAVEEWKAKLCGTHILVGRIDGIAEDGSLVEHKTTSSDLNEYEYDLQWDEQMLVYMWLTGSTSIWYTMIRKPTIRQKKAESDEEFFDRMVAWYDEDTFNKIRVVKITRTQKAINECIDGLVTEMNDICALEGEEEGAWYKNTCYCKYWGRRCEYSNICLNYDPNETYVDFVKGERTWN